jgi:hypothetical protein
VALGLAGRDDADDVALRAVAVADHEQSQAAAQAEQDKPIFVFGVVRVINELGVLVCEDSLSVVEAHGVLSQVRSRLLGIPLESEHSRSVRTLYIHCKRSAERRLCGLTFELSGRQRQDARPGLAKMYRVPPDRAWWPAVGAPLERGVRRHRASAVPAFP